MMRPSLLAAALPLMLAPVAGATALPPPESFDAWPATTSWSSYAHTNGWSAANMQVRATAAQWPAPRSLPHALWLQGTGLASWVQSPALAARTAQLTFWLRRHQPNQGTGSLTVLHSTNAIDWQPVAALAVTNDAWQRASVDISAHPPGAYRIAQQTAGSAFYYTGLDDLAFLETPALNHPNPQTTPRRQFLPTSRRTPLTISEIMYHPAARADGRDLEFIELFNTEPVSQHIGGYRLSGDIDFTFPSNATLAARAYVVVARDPAALAAAHAITNVLGPYTNALPNDAGRVRLRDEFDAVLIEVDYRDRAPWPVAADGAGPSLALTCPDYGAEQPRAWAPSAIDDGSPGAPEPDFAHALDGLIVNEILAHTDLPDIDFIELRNTTAATQTLDGCTLSDAFDTDKFTVPAGTTLAPGAVVAFTQTQLGFSLSSHGDEVILRAPGGFHVLDALRFDAQANGVASGHAADTTPGIRPLVAPTPGAPNAAARLPLVVINEIMFAPISGREDDAYIELHNPGTATVSLANWRFLDGIEFAFPTNASLPSGAFAVVARNLTNLLARYPQLTPANAFGNYRGQLSNRGERLSLARPDDPALPYADFVVVDDLTFDDGWAEWADGGGSSLELVDPRADRRVAANWSASDERAKAPWVSVVVTGTVAYGSGTAGEIQFAATQAGEYLLDDVELASGGTTNAVVNANFDAGLAAWDLRGNHVRSSLDPNGYSGTPALHIRASGRGDVSGSSQTFAWHNHAAGTLTFAPAAGATVVIRARARWLRGWPFATLTLSGDWMEAPIAFPLPPAPGSPGLPNGAARPHPGPAIVDVAHSPLLPAALAPVSVACRLASPDGPVAASLRYRLDPATNWTSVPMTLDPSGFHSASLPGQPAGTLVAFGVVAADAFATNRWPASPAYEGLVRFGEPVNPGVFGGYRLWLTATNEFIWRTRETHDNEPVPATLVYDQARASYGATGRYRGGWREFNGPAGTTMCAYSITVPKSERLHGDPELKFDLTGQRGRDLSRQAERYCQWLARQLGQPYANLRLVHLRVNGALRHPLHEYETPGLGFIRGNFPDDPNPCTFKQMNERALENFPTPDGGKAQWFYRDRWKKRRPNIPDDDYTPIFRLVDAFNNVEATQYAARTAALADYASWSAYFAINHIVANIDSWGYQWHHNVSVYVPPDARSRLFIYDMDMAFEDPTTSGLFQNNDPVTARLYGHPPFRRHYWRVLQEAVNGPLLASRYGPYFDELDAAMTTNGMLHGGTATWESWLSARRTFILSQAATANIDTNFAILSNGGADFATNASRVTLAGTAPIAAAEFFVNGRPCTPAFPALTAWSMTVPLAPGPNPLQLEARDRFGHPLATDSITVTATAPPPPLGADLVISEIMYHATWPGGDYVEILNRSASNTLDLSGCRLEAVDFTFPIGTFLAPGQVRVVAENLAAYAQAYSNAEAVVGDYAGDLDNAGECLALLAPGPDSNTWYTLDSVCYDDAPPWPPAADGRGAALQLIDPAQDNDRPGNWTAVDPAAPPGWQFATATGLTTGSPAGINNATLCFWLTDAGQAIIDGVTLVSGTVAQAGSSFARNGQFEAPLAPDWQPVGTHAGSFITNGAGLAGSPALAVVASAAGSATNHTVKQTALGLARSTTYTLGYWYWPLPGAGSLVVQLVQSTLIATQSVAYLPYAFAPFTPGASNTFAATLPPFPLLWLNELMATNTTTTVDNFGEHAPWLELLNADTQALALADFGLSDTYTDLHRWTFPAGASIGPGERVLVWLDGQTNQTAAEAWHADFTPAPAGGDVILTRAWFNRTIVIDALAYGPLAPDTSFGAYPDGDPHRRLIFHAPTPGQANVAQSQRPALRFNEWLADNRQSLADPADGRFQDWLELVNTGAERVHLGGYQLTDAPAASNRFTIPGGRWLDAGAFLLVWADGEPAQNQSGRDLHVDFALARGGESLALFAPDGTLLDQVTFGPQASDVTEGRWPDGRDPARPLWYPTPGAPNAVFTIRAVASVPAGGVTITWPAIPAKTYRIDSAANLIATNWLPVGMVTAVTDLAVFTDTSAPAAAPRFYRLTELP